MDSFTYAKSHCILTLLCINLINHVSSSSMPYLTMEEHTRFSKFLGTEISKTYPSDADDQSEVVIQQAEINKGIIYYNLAVADGNQHVFIAVGTKAIGKNVHVLFRRDDYLDPLNKGRFVVLRKRSSGNEYNVHLAVIWRDARQAMHVIWENVVISLRPNIRDLIDYMTPKYALVDTFHEESRRPACGWFGVFLLCDSETKVDGKGIGDILYPTPSPLSNSKLTSNKRPEVPKRKDNPEKSPSGSSPKKRGAKPNFGEAAGTPLKSDADNNSIE